MMRTIPYLCIVGRSKSGKTTVTELLIKCLVKRGFRVGAIKHTNKNFEFDKKGKDSYRHRKSGASVVALSSPKRIAIFRDLESPPFLEEIIKKYMENVDLVIVEGYKKSSSLKIEVIGNLNQEAPLFKGDDKIVAIISDRDFEVKIPIFRFNEIDKITDFIIETILTKSQTIKGKATEK